jgi:hypothetical protein
VPEVDGAAGVQRAMRLYGELIAAAADVVAAVAAAPPSTPQPAASAGSSGDLHSPCRSRTRAFAATS